jgi:hypothetical protein
VNTSSIFFEVQVILHANKFRLNSLSIFYIWKENAQKVLVNVEGHEEFSFLVQNEELKRKAIFDVIAHNILHRIRRSQNGRE